MIGATGARMPARRDRGDCPREPDRERAGAAAIAPNQRAAGAAVLAVKYFRPRNVAETGKL